jgi:hypothetical protein
MPLSPTSVEDYLFVGLASRFLAAILETNVVDDADVII